MVPNSSVTYIDPSIEPIIDVGSMILLHGPLALAFYGIAIVFMLMAMVGKLEWPIAFMAFLMPLRNIIDSMHVFPLGNDLVDILLISLLIGLLVQGMSHKDQRIIDRSPINMLIVFMVIYTFLSTIQGSIYLGDYSLFSPSNPRVQVWKNYCVLPLLFFIAYNGIRDKRSIWRLICVMGITMMVMNYYVYHQIQLFGTHYARGGIVGTFVHLGPNEVAAFFNQYTIILIAIYFYMKRSWIKLVLLVLIVFNTFTVLFLLSRAAYAGLAVGLFFLFAVKSKKWLIPMILVAVFWQVALPEKVRQRIEMTTDDYGELDASSANRLLIWEESWDMFNENPVLGVGFGVYSQLGFSKADTHNIYLKFLAEQGLIGIFIFLILLFILFVQGIRLFIGGEDDLSKGLGLGFAIAIIVLMCNNVFGDRWMYIEISSYFWIFAAFVCRLIVIEIEAKKTEKKRNRPKMVLSDPAINVRI